jgi:DNA-binding MarR family transcriptional regulator
MNQRQIGYIVLILGILVAIMTYAAKVREDNTINTFIKEHGNSCYLSDGTCLHEDRSYIIYYAGASISAALIALAAYLIFFDRTQTILAKQHREVSYALREAKKTEDKKGKFDAFLAGFSDEERKLLIAIHEQDGIQQSTLRYKTGQSKAMVSVLLGGLEQKGVVSREEAGKTNRVYLKKVF